MATDTLDMEGACADTSASAHRALVVSEHSTRLDLVSERTQLIGAEHILDEREDTLRSSSADAVNPARCAAR